MAKSKKISVDRPEPPAKKEMNEALKKRLEKLKGLPPEQLNKIRRNLSIKAAVHKLIEKNKTKK